MKTDYRLMAFAAPLALLASPAQAAQTVTFDLASGATALQGKFVLDGAQLLPPVEFDADYFVVENVSGTFGGTAQTADSITFNGAVLGGGLSIQLGQTFLTFLGAPLYSGSTAAPRFTAGSYTLLDDVSQRAVTVTVGVSGAVPEPATWAMMVAGFGAIGFAMRRRARVRVAYA